MKYVTRLDRFVIGDYPMVCVRSGRPATKMVPVEARRAARWPWLFFPGLGFLLAHWVADSDRPWGLLPFAEGEVAPVDAVYEKGVGVILRNVHPAFVEATRVAQGKAPVDVDTVDGVVPARHRHRRRARRSADRRGSDE